MKRDSHDYLSFLQSTKTPSKDLDLAVLIGVRKLKQKEWLTFLLKIGAIHFISGLVTFFFCPQFGLNPFKSSPHLPHIFMSYGVWACGLLCGSIFMGSGALIRFAFFDQRERVLADKKGLKVTLILSSLIYGLFMLVGSQIGTMMLNYSIVFFIFWLIGALLLERASNLIFNRAMLTS